MRMLVFEFRMIGYDYFLDTLQPYELTNLFDAIPFADRTLWETTRLKIFSTASMFSKGNLTVQELIRLPWDGETEETPITDITDSDIERLRKQAIKFETILNNGTGL